MHAPRFLVLRGGAIGDFVMTLPALAALRSRWPDCHIELVGYPRIAVLALEARLVDRVRSLDDAHVAQYFSFRPEVRTEEAEHLRSFDVAVSYLYDPSGVVVENLRRLGVRQVIYGSPKVETRHAVDQLMAPLAELAVFPEGRECPRLTLAAERVAAAQCRLAGARGGTVALHPGSGSARKNWPLARFAELAGRLHREGGREVIFIAGEADAEIAEALPLAAPGFPVVSDLDLRDLAALLSACAGYVGNDSGVTHIAAAVGIPVVALYGPTDAALWGPRGPNARVIMSREKTAEGLALIRPDEVRAALIAQMA